MSKLMAFWKVLGEGRMVADPVFWKQMQSVGQPTLASFLIGLVALLKGTKYEIQIPDETLGLIAAGIFATVNWVLTRITTTKDIRILPILQPKDPLPEIAEHGTIPTGMSSIGKIDSKLQFVASKIEPVRESIEPRIPKSATVEPESNLYRGG